MPAPAVLYLLVNAMPPPHRNGRRHPLLCLLLFAAFLLLTIRVLPQGPEFDPAFAPALSELKEKAETVTAVILGPSYTLTGISPALLNQKLTEHGVAASAVVFAASQMGFYESMYYLETILALDLPRLEWVVADATLWQSYQIDDANAYAPRTLLWHRWGNLYSFIVLSMHDGSHSSWSSRMRTIQRFMGHALARSLGLGQGVRHLRSAWGIEVSRKANAAPLPIAEARQRFHTDPAYYSGLVDGLVKAENRKISESPFMKLAVERFRALVERWGKSPVLFIAPVSDISPAKGTSSDSLGGTPLIDFSRPSLYPQLYLKEYRVDANHLNVPGAHVFTTLMADHLSALMRQRRD